MHGSEGLRKPLVTLGPTLLGPILLGLMLLGLMLPGMAGCAGPSPVPAAGLPAVAEPCPGAHPIEILASDVAILIDRSRSTREPSGVDIDGDGVVGEFRYSQHTDLEDSLLAAQLAAVERLVRVAELGEMRFAIVSYSGRSEFPLEDPVTQRVDREDARLEADLTGDAAQLRSALARVWRRGSSGASSFAPAMRLAVRSLGPADAERPGRRRRVLLIADDSTPVRFAPARRIVRDDPRMEIEARRAIDAGISFYSFAIGGAAEGEPPHTLARIAGATGGVHRAVPDPTRLYCEQLAALRVESR